MATSKRLRFEVMRRPAVPGSGDAAWRPIPGLTGAYEVSSDGHVRSLKRSVEGVDGRRRLLRSYLLRQRIDTRTGYLKVTLHQQGRPIHKYVHALVAEAFLGTRPAGMEVAHGDGSKTNNRPENLRYVTPAENQADRVTHGTSNRGTRNAWAVLNEADVLGIVRLLEAGHYQHQVAARFGVRRTTISAVATGRSWGHLTGRSAGANV